MSAASANSMLRVNAMPCTAITTGFGTGGAQTPNGSKSYPPESASGPLAATAGPTSARSSPAEKCSPTACTTPTRSSGSLPSAW